MDLGQPMREVRRMTWWDLADLNEARRLRAESAKGPRVKASAGSLMAFGGIAPPPR